MIKKINLDPKAIKLIESLRNIGYDFKTAIADLIDNSISANSSKICIDINCDDGEYPPYVLIADDGNGMDSKNLREAMRYASSNEQSSDSLGKYGLGLKTASLSQCRVLTVASRPKPQRDKRSHLNIMKWDMTEVYATDEWIVLNPKIDQLNNFEKALIREHLDNSYGTVVIWSDLEEIHPQLKTGSYKEKERYLYKLISETKEHLRMIFHRYIEGSVKGKKKIVINIEEKPVKPWNPFYPLEKTESLDIYEPEIEYKDSIGEKKKSKVIISPYILPTQKDFSTEEIWKDAGLKGQWNKLQGFYFYRNGRMLQAGGWSRLRSPDEHTKLLRIAIDFYPSLDKNFKINISKMKASIPSEIKDTLERLTKLWASEANRKYRKKNKDQKKNKEEKEQQGKEKKRAYFEKELFGIKYSYSNEHQQKIIASKKGKTGQINISLTSDHPAMTIFEKNKNKKDQIKSLCYVILSLLEAVKSNRIKVKDISLTRFYRELERI